MRKFIALSILLVFLCSRAYADVPFRVDAKAAVLIEADTGRVLYAQNADEMLPMASTTKIMTALIALERGSLSDAVSAPEEACGITGTSIYLTPGEILTLEQLLYGLMLRSGNDAAAAIAIHIGGSQNDFVALMNKKALEMNIDANFENPHGLDEDGHKASALALAMIMREALKNEDFRTITGTQKKIIPWEGNEFSRVLQNKNRLLTSYEGTVGGKTGYTGKAGRCLVFAAERNGMTLIGCVLNCSTWFDTAEKLLDYGFENFSLKSVYTAGEVLDKTEVVGGQRRYVELCPEENVVFPLGLDEKYTVNLQISKATAPVKKDAVAGMLNIQINGENVMSAKLLYRSDVARNDIEGAMLRIIRGWPCQFSVSGS